MTIMSTNPRGLDISHIITNESCKPSSATLSETDAGTNAVTPQAIGQRQGFPCRKPYPFTSLRTFLSTGREQPQSQTSHHTRIGHPPYLKKPSRSLGSGRAPTP